MLNKILWKMKHLAFFLVWEKEKVASSYLQYYFNYENELLMTKLFFHFMLKWGGNQCSFSGTWAEAKTSYWIMPLFYTLFSPLIYIIQHWNCQQLWHFSTFVNQKRNILGLPFKIHGKLDTSKIWRQHCGKFSGQKVSKISLEENKIKESPSNTPDSYSLWINWRKWGFCSWIMTWANGSWGIYTKFIVITYVMDKKFWQESFLNHFCKLLLLNYWEPFHWQV